MSLADILVEMLPAVATEVEKLLGLINLADDPMAAVKAAQRAVITDAANAATDEALRHVKL